MTKVEKTYNSKCGQGYRELELSYIGGRDVNNINILENR